MYIEKVNVKNFRLLKDVSISLQDETTVIVGRNNSGKTSLTEIFRRFSKHDKFKLEDFSLSSINDFKNALNAKTEGKNEDEIRNIIPSINLELIVNYNDNKDDYGNLSNFIIDLDDENYNAIIKISFTLQNGKINAFFEDLAINQQDFYDIIKERIQKYYEFEIKAIDPTDTKNISKTDYENYNRLIKTNFINAQRWLDDETVKENDILGKVIASIFNNASKDTAPLEMQSKSKELDDVVKTLQKSVDSEFNEKVKALIPALEKLGYPGLNDPRFTTKTTFDAKTIIEKNTKLLYEKSNGISLPEAYNGLGSRNLIFILFHLFDYFRQYQSDPIQAKSHIIFIEEPEAHLHPQMQEVFIRQLNKIVEVFSKDLKNKEKWPVQFIVTTHSTHIANEADFDTIRYFLVKGKDESLQTNIKDLNEEFKKPDLKGDKAFIHKYLTLTKCDLFFADKAILIEGATERILMPELIKKLSSTNLNSQYISIIEIGGAYAHHFYKFLDFLELKTLIITDIDSINEENKACLVSEGKKSSNAGINKWFKNESDYIKLSDVRSKNCCDKLNGLRRIAYQTNEDKNDKECCGRSFEDAFIITNPSLFGLTEKKDALAKVAYKEAEKYSNKKTDFAIKYAFTETEWQIPHYIKEGLEWLAE